MPSSPAPARLAGGLLAGARIALSGLRFSLGSTAIRRSYARMLMAMALGGALLFVLLFGLTLYFSWPEGEVEGEHIALWVAGFFISMVLAPLISILGVRILAPTFAEQVLHTALREHSPDLAQRATDAKGLSFMTGLIYSLRRFMLWAVWAVLAVILGSVVPPLAVVTALVMAVLTAYHLGWELLDPWYSMIGRPWAEQRTQIAEQRGLLLGFGGIAAGVSSIPILGLLAWGALQGAAAELVSELEAHSPSA